MTANIVSSLLSALSLATSWGVTVIFIFAASVLAAGLISYVIHR